MAHPRVNTYFQGGLLEFRLSNDPGLSARDLKIILYCKNSGRAALACRALHEMGYLHVRLIAGGIDDWSRPAIPLSNQNQSNLSKKLSVPINPTTQLLS